MTTMSELMASKHLPKGAQFVREKKKSGIINSAEMNRIANLPRRVLNESTVDRFALSALLRRPGSTATLMLDQALALREMSMSPGTFINMEVGSGKGLLSLLSPMIRGSQRPLLFVPAANREDTLKDVIPRWREHFPLHPNLHVESYEMLSSPKSGARLLETLNPDHIILDEADKLKDLGVARGIRFFDHFKKNPRTHLDAMSGSFFDRSLRDMIYIMRLCLGIWTPLPFAEDELDMWCCAVDSDVEDDQRVGIGVLHSHFYSYLSNEEKEEYESEVMSEPEKAMLLITARMRETPGVIFTTQKTTNVKIYFHEVKPRIPDKIKDHFEKLKETWETPRGDEVKDAIHMYRTISQLSQGFFYRRVWPVVDGVEKPDLIWIDALKHWNRFIRKTVLNHENHGLHSSKPVKDACERYEAYQRAKTFGDKETMARLSLTKMLNSQEYRNWMAVKHRYAPVNEVVWIDEFLVNEVSQWLEDNVGIAWCGSIAFGEKLRSKGWRYYAGGQHEIRYETVSCAASIKSHGRGKNLQVFNKGVVIDGPTRGRDWQQLIGRFDRANQLSPRVDFWLPLHVRELWQGFYQANRDARYAAAARQAQKLVSAESYMTTTLATVSELIRSGDPLWRFPTN